MINSKVYFEDTISIEVTETISIEVTESDDELLENILEETQRPPYLEP